MVEVTLFTKDGCHLCDEVEADLRSLQATYPHDLQKVDITIDPELFERYRYTIPVVRIRDVELAAPIGRAELVEALAGG
ncbi:MAG: glutaredoxin family protein [Candidatus Promineifilaceae bacterium]|nr:glutaredoxin family protein [Candidatus Promineifilaceae bacterium]